MFSVVLYYHQMMGEQIRRSKDMWALLIYMSVISDPAMCAVKDVDLFHHTLVIVVVHSYFNVRTSK